MEEYKNWMIKGKSYIAPDSQYMKLITDKGF